MVTVMGIATGAEVNILVLNGLHRCLTAREEGEVWILMACT